MSTVTPIAISMLPVGTPLGTDETPATDITDLSESSNGTTKRYYRWSEFNYLMNALGYQTLSACRVATVFSLVATYNNGLSGVGATLTNSSSMTALIIDDITMVVGDRVLVWNQVAPAQNGIYTVTAIGSNTINWVLTRAVDYDSPSEILEDEIVLVNSGLQYENKSFQMISSGPFVIGTTAILFELFILGELLIDSGSAGDLAYYANDGFRLSPVTTNNNGVLVTGDTGLPSISSTLPANIAATGMVLTAPLLGTPASGNLANCTGLPVGTGLVPGNVRATLVTDAAEGIPTWSSPMNDGQIIIGATGSIPLAQNITPGSGIDIVNAENSIMIANTSLDIEWYIITGTTYAAEPDEGYIIGNAAQTTITLPAVAAIGESVTILGMGTGGWILAANTGQIIHLGAGVTSSAGSINSAHQYDNVKVFCLVENTEWTVIEVVSTGLTVVNGASMTTRNALDLTLSGQTGTGAVAGSISPTFVTPTLGAAAATSLTLANPLAVNYGGTGTVTAPNAGQIPVGTSGGIYSPTTIGSGTNILVTSSSAAITVSLEGVIAGANGGTGVNNGANTLTLAGNLATLGAYPVNFTFTGSTNVTFPTSGTIVTDADVVASIQGTANQILVNGTTGSPISGTDVILTTPQNIGTASTPTFAGLTAGNLNLASNALISNNSNGNISLTPNGTGTVLVGSTTSVTLADLEVVSSSSSQGGISAVLYSSSSPNQNPILGCFRARGSSGSPSAVASNDVIAQFQAIGYDGTAFSHESGSILISVSGTVGANVVPGQMTFRTANTSGTSVVGMTLSNAQVLTLAHALPVASGGTGITSFGTGVATALGVNTNSTGGLAVETDGTFTPALAFGGSSSGITYSTQTGFYSGIGNTVNFSLTIILTSKGSSTGAATITGIPVSSRSGPISIFSVSQAGVTYAAGTIIATLGSASSTINIQNLVSSSGESSINDTEFSGTATITVSGSYLV